MTLKKQRVGKVFKVYAITCRCALIRTIFLIVIALMLTLLWQEKNRLSKPISHRNFNDIVHFSSGKMLLKRRRKRVFHCGLPGHRFTLWRGVWGKRKPGQWYPVASPLTPSPENRGWLLLLIPFTKLKMSARLHSMRPSSTSELTITTSGLLL